jgi:hypothetical protein
LNEPVAVTVRGPVEVQGSVEVLTDALKTVFNKTISGGVPAGASFNTLTSLPVIPDGKRLIIETISVWVTVTPNQKATAFLLTGGVGTIQHLLRFAIPLTSQGVYGSPNPSEYWTGTQKVRIVIDPRYSNQPSFNVYRTGTDIAGFLATIAGYLEDIPATL